MYNNKNKNKGVKIGLIAGFFAVLIGCLIAFVSNPFLPAEKAGDSTYTQADGGEWQSPTSITAPERTAQKTAASDPPTPAYTVESGGTAAEKVQNWNRAIQYSIDNSALVKFVLSNDWVASVSGSTTSFGTGTGFSGGSLYIPSRAKILLDLNGHTLDRNLASKSAVDKGSVISVKYAYLYVVDSSASGTGKITGGNTTGVGGGITTSAGENYNEGCTVNIYGGSITGNKATSGGGIALSYFTSVDLYDGEISFNTTTGTGGAIYSSSSYTSVTIHGGKISHNASGNTGGAISSYNTYIYGGEISYNTARGDGSALYVYSFYMYDGKICNNYGDACNGAVFASDYANISGGEITNNTTVTGTVAGVYVGSSNSSPIYLGGSAKIYDNTKAGKNSNLYVTSGKPIQIGSKFENARIGITASAAPMTVTKGFTDKNYAPTYQTYFFSDDSSRSLTYSDDEVQIVATPDTRTELTWQYSAGDGKWTDASGVSVSLTYSGETYSVRALNKSGEAVKLGGTAATVLSGYKAVSTNAIGITSIDELSQYINPQFTLTITPLQVKIGWEEDTLRYNGNKQYPQPVISGLIHGDKVTVNVNSTNAGTNAGSGYSVTATGLAGADAGNYELASGTYTKTYSILRAQLEKPTSTGNNEFMYDGTEHTYTVALKDGMSISANKGTNAGNYKAAVSLNKTNYEWTDGTQTNVEFNWTINKKQIYVAGIKVADKAYDGTKSAQVDTDNVRLVGVIDGDLSKLNLEFAAGSEFDSAAVGLRSVAITGVTLTGEAAGNYLLDFDEVTSYAQIYPATITASGLTVKNGGKPYDGTVGGVVFDTSAIVLTAVDGGIAEGEKADLITNLTISGAYRTKNVGTDGVVIYNYILGGQYAGNYILDMTASQNSADAEITKAEVEVTLGKSEYAITYGNALKITYSQTSPVKSESINLALEYYDEHGNIKLDGEPADAGKYLVKVVVDGADPNVGNYIVKDGEFTEATVTINKASLTVTAEDKSIEYGSAKPADGDYNLIYNGWLNGDSTRFENGEIAFITAITITTDYAQGGDVGDYGIVLSDGALANYELTFVDGTLTVVSKKVTVIIDDKSSVYGAEEAELTSDGTADMQITLSRADEVNKSVGKYVITGVSANANYAVTFVDGVYEITKATLTVTANPNAITYGDVASNDGVTYSGFADGEDESALNGTLGYRYTYTQYGDIYEADGSTLINYYIIPYGLTADNYDVVFVNGLLTVNKKAATVTVSNASSDITNVLSDRTEAAQKINYEVAGTVNGDDLLVVLTIDENGTRQDGNATFGVTWCAVGTYNVTGTFENANYVVTFVYEGGATHGTYTVKQGTLTITANMLIISYGDEITFGAYTDIDSLVTAEGLPVGSTLQDLIDSGVVSGALTVTDSTYSRGDDIFAADGTRIKYTFMPSGLASSSYNIIFKTSPLMIEQKSIIVNLDGKSIVYGENDKELTASVEDGALYGYDANETTVVDFLKITGLKREEGKDAGSYAITAEGCDNKNYRVTFVNGVYTITQYEVTVEWISGNDDAAKFEYVYNGENQAPVATFTMPNPADPENPLVFRSTDEESSRVIEVTGSGLNAGSYKAQAFLLNNNLKFSPDTKTTQNFIVEQKQLTVTWYKEDADKGDATKAIDAKSTKETPVEYKYRSGYPYAPVVTLSGIIDKDNSASFYYISGEQSSVSITPYAAVLHILNANYCIANDDAIVYFTIVVSSPEGFKWYTDATYTTEISSLKEYVYNGAVQHPVAKALGEVKFVYTYYKLADAGDTNGTEVYETIHVGNYKIVATPVDGNLKLTESEATFYYNVTAKTVTVDWGKTVFEYNGSVQAPVPVCEGVDGTLLKLTVTADDSKDAGEYGISATLSSDDYTFAVDGENVKTVETRYTITAKNITISWTSKYTDEDGNYKWDMVYNNQTQNDSVQAFAEMLNEVADDNVGLEMTVWYQADGKSEPVQVNSIKDAGIYTLRVALSNQNDNYRLTDSEQTFDITRKELTVTATNKEMQTGASVPVLTATFEGFADGENETTLNLVNGNGGMKYLSTNYNLNSPYIDASEYTKAEDISKLETVADIEKGNVKGYFIALTDSEASLAELKSILKNYNVTFVYGRMTIIAVEGTVSIVLTQSYNGEDQTPAAMYKVGDKWIDLKVDVYEDADRTKRAESVKNVGTYYLIISKYVADSVKLEGAEADGSVRKEFNIIAREIEVNITDKNVVYGELTEENAEEFLAGLWEYASKDALRRPLEQDENKIDISLKAEIAFTGGFANAGNYIVTGEWSEDEALRNNYRVVFIGSNGANGELKITEAEITYTANVTDGFNQILETDKANGNYLLGLYSKKDGKYEYIDIVGDENANIKIQYSNIYDRSIYELTDNLPQNEPDAAWKEMPLCSIPVTADGSYYVNFKVEVANHKPYYGQWTVQVIAGKAYIRIIFSDKQYTTVYGEATLSGSELAAKLLKEGYVNCLDLTEDMFRENVENGNLTAKVLNGGEMNVGSYAIVFEGIEKLNPDWIITYKQDVNASDDAATNIGRYVIEQRKLTISWDKTSFVYDGQQHLPLPDIDGWTRAEEIQTVNGATVYKFTNEELGKTLTLSVRTNGGDFTSVGGENFVIAEIDDGNYLLDSFNATRAVSITGEMGDLPAVSNVGLPGWALAIIIAFTVLNVIMVIILATIKKKTPVGDNDGFYEEVKPED